MLTEDQEFELISGRECLLHTHSLPQLITGDITNILSSFEKEVQVNGNYTPFYTDDILLCNSSGYTITLPIGKAGKKYTLVKLSSTGTITVQGTGQTVNGASSISLTTAYTPVTLKFTKINGWVSV